MDPGRRTDLSELLDTTLPSPGQEAPRSLRRILNEDPALSDELARALNRGQLPEAGEAAPSFSARLGFPPSTKLGGKPSTKLGGLQGGDRIGPYRIERLLGRGGMGVVYLAVRQDDFEQRVALKLVGAALPSAEQVDRFFRERQILADLQHPNIARLYDGGTTPEALPYFAMEYVEGEPIDAFCERNQLPIGRRLELFQKVCAGVRRAHQQLIVHRDLKPGNVLVTADGEPKLLDFGIAKLLPPTTGDPAELRELTTDAERQLMTPAFASPEQFVGQPVTTVSDVYSLGLILYQLVCGSPAYRLRGKSLQQALHLVCHAEPVPPSRMAREGGEAIGRISNDLDSIVLKAIRKEPEHRYGSVAELSADLDRHRAGLPVEAHRGSWLYRTGKLVRRHTLAVFLLLLIVAFGTTSTALWRQAVREQRRAESAALRAERAAATAIEERAVAERQYRRAEEVSQFLESLLAAADPDVSRGGQVPVQELLDRGFERILGGLEEDPELRADLSGTLGSVYNDWGLYEEARVLKEEALKLRRASDPGDRPKLATDLNNLAVFHYDLGDYARAKPLFREALAIFARLGERAPVATIQVNLASILTHQGRRDEALALHHEALETRRDLYGDDDPRVASSLHSLGILHYTSSRFEVAEPLLREALRIYRDHYGDEHTRVASAWANLGSVLFEQGKVDEAEALYEQALELRLTLLGADHPLVANVRKSWALLLLSTADPTRAEALIRAALEALRAQKPEDDWTRADAESVWGAYLLEVGRLAEARPVLESSYRRLLEVKGEDDLYTRRARQRLDRYGSLSGAETSGTGSTPGAAGAGQ